MPVDGRWAADREPAQATDTQGFLRGVSGFRHAGTPDGHRASGPELPWITA